MTYNTSYLLPLFAKVLTAKSRSPSYLSFWLKKLSITYTQNWWIPMWMSIKAKPCIQKYGQTNKQNKQKKKIKISKFWKKNHLGPSERKQQWLNGCFFYGKQNQNFRSEKFFYSFYLQLFSWRCLIKSTVMIAAKNPWQKLL